MTPSSRRSRDQRYMRIAQTIAEDADCTRRRVGAVIVQGDRIVATGYNGAPAGRPGCLSAGACPRGRLSYADVSAGSSYDTGPGSCIAIHAEANALLRASWADMVGATLYVTSAPCDGCARLISATGITRVVLPEHLEAGWPTPPVSLVDARPEEAR